LYRYTTAQPEWRIIVNPLAEMDRAPHEVFAQPVARMRLMPSAKHLLDGTWQLLAPVRHEFEMTLSGQGVKRESWQETLGMAADAKLVEPINKDRRDWSVERWSEYKVTYAAHNTVDLLDQDIAGTYKLFDKCGTAQDALHKRVSSPASEGSSGTSSKSAEMFMFLDPMRNSKGCMDFFVFADNHRRLQYGEHRIHTARMDPKFRPSVGGCTS
jgi:hypothetical protein